MRHSILAICTMAAAVLAACGGNGPRPGEQSPRLKFSTMVSFGDNISDVGTYKVGAIAAMGGGTFTINGNNTATNPALTGKNWSELIATQLGLPAPCPAVTGLDGDPALGFSVAVQANANCYAYAQGGARVSNPIGEGHKATGNPLGALTWPFATQVQNHLTKAGGKFKGDEIIFVAIGNIDLMFGLTELAANATAAGLSAGRSAFATSLATQLAAGATDPASAAQAIGAAIAAEAARPGSDDNSIVLAAVNAAVLAGNSAAASPAVFGPMAAKAQADAAVAGTAAGNAYAAAQGPLLVQTMTRTAGEVVSIVKGQLLGNGANQVAVINMPDVSSSPAGQSQPASTRALIDTIVKSFNDTLAAGFASEGKVLLIDAFTNSRDQFTNPTPYGLTNNKEPACDLSPAKNPLASALVCNGSNLKAGDVSHYAYADLVNPTPYLQWLLARQVAEKMIAKGWL